MNGLMRIDGDPVTWLIEFVGIVFLAAGALSFVLLLALKPALGRYALAKPNARSSHKKPTPQGGGIAVVAATVAMTAIAAILYPGLIGEFWRLAVVFACVIALAAVGISDDVQPMAARARLLLQAAAVALTVTVLPDGMRVLAVPPLVGRARAAVRWHSLVCERRQFHGRHRLDHGRGSRACHRWPWRYSG